MYSGLIGWKPNEDAVLYFYDKIYSLLKEKLPDVKWFIVGKNPRQIIQKLSVHDQSITVTGTVPEVKPYIEKCHVVVVPLRVGSGTRLKILEAMALGRAVVSTSIGCEGLEVTHGKNILIADEPQDFATQVVRLFNDEVLRRRIVNNARQLVESTYDWEIIEKKVAQCFL